MKNKLSKILWIILMAYLIWSILLNIWFKDPIFKREIIIYNNSSNDIEINTSSKNEIFEEWLLTSGKSKSIIFNDTEKSKNKKENFVLKKNNKILLDSKQVNFRKLSEKEVIKTSSWVLIEWNWMLINNTNIFIPFYITQQIYVYKYKIEISD